MHDKEKLLKDIADHIEAGVITEAEVNQAAHASAVKIGAASTEPVTPVVAPVARPIAPQTAQQVVDADGNKMNASDILFTIGALVVYIAIVVFLAQSWSAIGAIGHIFFTLGLGIILWAVAARMIKDPNASEQGQGLGTALLFIGSLSVASGVIVTIAEFVEPDDASLGLGVFAAIIISSMHFGMDMIVKRTITSVMGVLYAVAAYGALVGWVFGEHISSPDFWLLVAAFAGLLVIGGGSLIYKADNRRVRPRTILWALGGFGVMYALFSLTWASDIQIFWQLLFPAVLYGAFVASIKSRSKNFLYSGAFFLFLYVVTMSFRYFGDGLGAAGALMFAGFGIIGSGMLVINLRKKYFL